MFIPLLNKLLSIYSVSQNKINVNNKKENKTKRLYDKVKAK